MSKIKDIDQKRQEEFEASDEFREFNKGFNHGYILSSNGSKILNSISERALLIPSPYSAGIQQGKKQHEREKILEKIKMKQVSKSKEKDRER